MNAKPKVRPENTHILDEEDVDQLDSLSITAILDEAMEADGSPSAPPRAPTPREQPAHGIDREPTIDELMEEPVFASEDTVQEMALEDTGTFEALDVLLPPELIFGDNGEE
jgi:hypothetical protein